MGPSGTLQQQPFAGHPSIVCDTLIIVPELPHPCPPPYSFGFLLSPYPPARWPLCPAYSWTFFKSCAPIHIFGRPSLPCIPGRRNPSPCTISSPGAAAFTLWQKICEHVGTGSCVLFISPIPSPLHKTATHNVSSLLALLKPLNVFPFGRQPLKPLFGFRTMNQSEAGCGLN